MNDGARIENYEIAVATGSLMRCCIVVKTLLNYLYYYKYKYKCKSNTKIQISIIFLLSIVF